MNIHHNPDEARFYIELEKGQAVLDYQLLSAGRASAVDKTVDFTRTYVPAEYRGRGYAEALVKHGLNWAKKQGLEVKASCWYVRGFL
ncbi:MAG: GNAT family N-acetyltransferase [Porticoccus sp.]|nr:GNAT family N-acetyltransferase [Porticoccus sp.]